MHVCVVLTRPSTRAGMLVGFTTSHSARQSEPALPPPGTSGTMGAPERMFGFRTAKVEKLDVCAVATWFMASMVVGRIA